VSADEPQFNADDPPGAPWAASFTPPRADEPQFDSLDCKHPVTRIDNDGSLVCAWCGREVDDD
jgi:hypothetical protein